MDSIKKFAEEHPFITGAIIIFICVVAYKLYEKMKKDREDEEQNAKLENLKNSLRNKDGLSIVLFQQPDFKSDKILTLYFEDEIIHPNEGVGSIKVDLKNKIIYQSLIAISGRGKQYFVNFQFNNDSQEFGLHITKEQTEINHLPNFFHTPIEGIKVTKNI